MPLAFRDVQYGTGAVGHRRQRLAKRPVGLRTNDAGNLRTGVPCSGSAAVRSRVTAADSLGGPIWDGSQPKPSPAASAASAGLARSTLRCKSQPTLWGHASRIPGRGWRGAVPPLTPPGGPRSGTWCVFAQRRTGPIVADRARLGGSARAQCPCRTRSTFASAPPSAAATS